VTGKNNLYHVSLRVRLTLVENSTLKILPSVQLWVELIRATAYVPTASYRLSLNRIILYRPLVKYYSGRILPIMYTYLKKSLESCRLDVLFDRRVSFPTTRNLS
jgi:hypothetical protein